MTTQTAEATTRGADGERPTTDERMVEQVFTERQIIVASNRGPVTFTTRDDGSFTSRQGSGGLVTAIGAVLRSEQAIWIAAAMTDGDRDRAKAAAEAGETLITPRGPGSRFRLRYVVPSPEAYHQYYNVISNPLLWFLQHYLWDTPRTPDIPGRPGRPGTRATSPSITSSPTRFSSPPRPVSVNR